MTMFDEELTVFEHDVHGYKVVKVAFWMVSQKLCHAAEGVDCQDGHDILQYLLQPQYCKGIGVDDSHAGSPLLAIHIVIVCLFRMIHFLKASPLWRAVHSDRCLDVLPSSASVPAT